eukprot:746560-Hanusia_phi.AAC.8
MQRRASRIRTPMLITVRKENSRSLTSQARAAVLLRPAGAAPSSTTSQVEAEMAMSKSREHKRSIGALAVMWECCKGTAHQVKQKRRCNHSALRLSFVSSARAGLVQKHLLEGEGKVAGDQRGSPHEAAGAKEVGGRGW